MQQAIPYSSGTSAWLPVARRGPSPASFLDRSSFERPLSGSSTTSTTTSSSAGADSVTSGGRGGSTVAAAITGVGAIRSLVSENPVLVLSRRGCCMCHVVRRLLLGLGVNPAVCEVDEDREETAVMEELTGAAAAASPAAATQFPAVFIGGRYVGGLDRLMAAHISGELVPILKEAGALWL